MDRKKLHRNPVISKNIPKKLRFFQLIWCIYCEIPFDAAWCYGPQGRPKHHLCLSSWSLSRGEWWRYCTTKWRRHKKCSSRTGKFMLFCLKGSPFVQDPSKQFLLSRCKFVDFGWPKNEIRWFLLSRNLGGRWDAFVDKGPVSLIFWWRLNLESVPP